MISFQERKRDRVIEMKSEMYMFYFNKIVLDRPFYCGFYYVNFVMDCTMLTLIYLETSILNYNIESLAHSRVLEF